MFPEPPGTAGKRLAKRAPNHGAALGSNGIPRLIRATYFARAGPTYPTNPKTKARGPAASRHQKPKQRRPASIELGRLRPCGRRTKFGPPRMQANKNIGPTPPPDRPPPSQHP
eukprot:6169674-Pyramimonas_sp.AAC.1